MPVNISISTYIDVRNLTAGEHPCVIDAAYETEDEVFRLAALTSSVDVEDPDLPCILVGGGMNLVAEKPGKLQIRLGVDGETPKVIDTLRVTLRADASSIA
jgi:hypothetical protein